MTDIAHIQLSISMIESCFNWGSSRLWTSYHFAKLSEEIFQKTGKLISESTLKRYFGKKDPKEIYHPQKYTKDAIAQYLGFPDWESFIISHQKSKKRLRIGFKTYLYIGSVLVIIVVLGLVFYFYLKQDKKVWISSAQSGKTVPYTAVYNYDVTGIRDSVFVDFGNQSRVYLPKDRHSITEFYKTAGKYTIRIFNQLKTFDSLTVFNYSNSWQAGYSPNDDYRRFEMMEENEEASFTERLFVPVYPQIESDPTFRLGHYREFRFLQPFSVSLDELEVSAVLKNSKLEGGKQCFDAEMWLIGSENNCRIRFVEPNCYRYGQLQISEKTYSGQFDDLKVLERDLKDWKKISLSFHFKEFRLFFENEQIYKEVYKMPLGAFRGFYFRFFGNGSVKSIMVSKGRQLIYQFPAK